MRAVLWGRDHTVLGELAVEPLGAACALAISKGGREKRWYYVDPNEDAVAAVAGPRATLLVVADGHNGWPATEAAVDAVLSRFGDDPPPADLSDADLLDVFWRAHEAVVGATQPPESPAPHSRTTLVVALSGDGRLQWGSFGDSAVYLVSDGCEHRLDQPQHRFVGHRSLPRAALPRTVDRGCVPLAGGEWLVVASDGFTDFAGAFPAAALRDVDADAATVAEALVRAAFAGGAGDNVAVGVLQATSGSAT